MSTTYTTTRDAIITRALRILGVLAQGESPTATMLTEGSEALNDLVKAWEADGMPLWAIREFHLPMVTNQAEYTMGPTSPVVTDKPLRIQSGYFHNGLTNIDIPMVVLTRDEYNRLGNKTATGQPVQFYYDPQKTDGTVHLFPVPNAVSAGSTNYIKLIYQRPFEDMNTATDAPDFPQEWFQAVKFGLAEALAPEYGVPLENYGHIRKVAKEYKDLALSMGTEEGSFYFQINRQGW